VFILRGSFQVHSTMPGGKRMSSPSTASLREKSRGSSLSRVAMSIFVPFCLALFQIEQIKGLPSFKPNALGGKKNWFEYA